MKKLIIAMLILSVCFFSACDSGGSSDTATTPPAATPLVVGDTVPEGAYFAKCNNNGGTVTYTDILGPGSPIPALTAPAVIGGVNKMDVFLYGDYIYVYGYNFAGHNSVDDGWGVSRAYDDFGINSAQFEDINISTMSDATPYTAKRICESIKGVNVKDMRCLFMDSPLTSLEDGFVIPAYITNMEAAFLSSDLGEVNLTIPSGVTNMNTTFQGCFNLKGTITVETTSTNVGTNYERCFKNAGKDTAAGDKITLVCSDATLKANLIATNVDGSSNPLDKVE